jgi:hypothetical protein
MSNPNPSRRKVYTNRLLVETNTYYWKVTVTPSHGSQVVGHYDNRFEVSRMGNTPSWFIKALKDLRDLTKYPHLPEVLDRVAVLVKNTEINNSREGRRPWGDVELDLMSIAREARDGVQEESLSNTYRVTPDDDEFIREARGSHGGFARGMGSVEPHKYGVCEDCFLEFPCACPDGWVPWQG